MCLVKSTVTDSAPYTTEYSVHWWQLIQWLGFRLLFCLISDLPPHISSIQQTYFVGQVGFCRRPISPCLQRTRNRYLRIVKSVSCCCPSPTCSPPLCRYLTSAHPTRIHLSIYLRGEEALQDVENMVDGTLPTSLGPCPPIAIEPPQSNRSNKPRNNNNKRPKMRKEQQGRRRRR